MSFGYSVLLFVSHISLTACSDRSLTLLHYRAVDGDVFMMPCEKWSKNTSWNEEGISNESYAQFQAEPKHSGHYKCLTRGGWQFLHLQVINKTTGCSGAEEYKVMLFIGEGGHITCPGQNCSNSTSIVWYKKNRSVSILKRKLSFRDGQLHLHRVDKYDNAIFFCDRELTEQGVKWTLRRSVIVKAINRDKYSPRIQYPVHNMGEEVELGLSHTLTCEVYFPQADPPGDVQWFVIYSSHLVKMTMEDLIQEEVEWEIRVIGKAILKQVTALELNRTYMCIASNTIGNNSVTISLKLKNKVQWLSLAEYSVGPLLFVAGLSIILRVKWLEVQLTLKSRWTITKPDIGQKDFDVFFSYVSSSSSTEMFRGEVYTSSPLRHKNDATFPFSLDPLKVEVPSQKLELLLPHVLEDQWGYRVCLMERDFLPGGVYTNDVANAIQQSQMLICLLSTEYLCDNNAVFVLESGLQALLQNSIRLLLIWTNRAAIPLQRVHPPLPAIVQKALKVLPALKWTTAKSTTNTNFWSSLKKGLPSHKVLSLSSSQN